MIEVSVVMATYRRDPLLEKCLQALLRQDFPKDSFEILVVDDGPQSSTRDLVERLGAPVRYLTQGHAGPAAARNLGLREARGTWVAMTDDDCEPDAGWLSAMVTAIRAAGEDAVGIQGATICPDPDPLTHWQHYLTGGWYATCNMLYRRDVLLRLGGFDENYPYPQCEDHDLAFRALQLGCIPFEASARVVHPARAQSVADATRKIRYFMSDFYSYWKCPAQFKMFRGLPDPFVYLLYEATVQPITTLWRWRKWFCLRPAALARYLAMSAGRAVYGGWLLLRIVAMGAASPSSKGA